VKTVFLRLLHLTPGPFLLARPCFSSRHSIGQFAYSCFRHASPYSTSLCTARCICGAAVDSTGQGTAIGWWHRLSRICRPTVVSQRAQLSHQTCPEPLTLAELPCRQEPPSIHAGWQQATRWRITVILVKWFLSGVRFHSSWYRAASRLLSGPGNVISEAEDRKRLKQCFIPVAVDTLGALGIDVTDFHRQLGRRIATVAGERGVPSTYWNVSM